MTDEATQKKSAKVLGTMQCLLCPHDVPVKEQKATGYAQYSCQWCGVQMYCRNDDSDARMRAKMKSKVEASPAPAVSPAKDAPKKEEKPAPRRSLLGT